MAGSTSKKIVAVRFDREPVQGFVNSQGYLLESGVEVLTTSGAVMSLPYADVKAVCFVRDFEPGPAWREHRAFANRPKTSGLWLRLHFRDADSLEGLISNNLMLMEPIGLMVAPPESGFQGQRIFVPRAALTSIQVLGVVGSPLRRTAKPKPAEKDQLKMFE